MNINHAIFLGSFLLVAACGGENAQTISGAAPEDVLAQNELQLREACFDKSQADACFFHAQHVELGGGVAADPEQAKLSYDKACSLKHASSCVMISLIGAPQGAMSEMLIKPVDNGAAALTPAEKTARIKYFRGQISENARGFPMARKLYGEACNEGLAQACLALGKMKRSGSGGQPDPSGGGAEFVRACDGGISDGCFALAKQQSEQGATRDDIRPTLQQACEDAHLSACAELGEPGPIANISATARRQITECENDNIASCVDAGMNYLTGEGVAVNKQMGRRYLIKGCNITQSDACQNVGHAQSRGFGGPVDMLGARFSFANACYGFGRAEAACFELTSN